MQSPESAKMSLAYVDEARTLGIMLEDRQAKRDGTSVEEARLVVARKIGAAPGTLRNLRKRRLKDVGASLLYGLNALLIRELEGELAHVEHYIETRKRAGDRHDSRALAQAYADLARIKTSLGIGEKS